MSPHRMKLFASIVLALAAGAAVARPAHAAQPYFPNPSHAWPANVPPDLVGKVAAAFHIGTAEARHNSFVRCAGATLFGCTVGANLVCGKADTRRRLKGATAWCRAHPNAKFIPLSATGHATIYNWSCKGRQAVAGKALMAVDHQGYIAGNWKKLR
jgi:hypothetical protein